MATPNEHGQNDDVRQAMEAGEPDLQGRDRGRVVDEKSGKMEGTNADQPGKAGDSQDWESGRHQSM